MTIDGMSDRAVRNILDQCRTVAIVGLSGNWYRPSYFAAKYLLERGYKVIPVNPNYEEVLGQPCVPELAAIQERVDVVDLFQRAEQVHNFVAPAAALGASTLWMQLGVVEQQAAEAARQAGMQVVMDRCMKIEYARLFGGLNWAGVNTGIISARRPRHLP